MDTKLAAKMIPALATQIAAANTHRARHLAAEFGQRIALIASPEQAAEIDTMLDAMWN